MARLGPLGFKFPPDADKWWKLSNIAKRHGPNRNQIYSLLISNYMYGLPYKAKARLAIGVFNAALTHTYQDSGRFAYNWFLSFGKEGTNEPARWARPGGVVGSRGEQRTRNRRTAEVVNKKREELGLMAPSAKETSFYKKVMQRTRKGGNYSLRIYNPLMRTPPAAWPYTKHAVMRAQFEQQGEFSKVVHGVGAGTADRHQIDIHMRKAFNRVHAEIVAELERGRL